MREELGIDDWLELVKEDKNLNGAYISFAQYMYLLEQENQELKKQLEDSEKAVGTFFNGMVTLKNQQKEFIEYMESEKDRLTRECSQIYEDSLGKTRLVNEDIFNEVDNNLSKYKEIIGGKDDI